MKKVWFRGRRQTHGHTKSQPKANAILSVIAQRKNAGVPSRNAGSKAVA